MRRALAGFAIAAALPFAVPQCGIITGSFDDGTVDHPNLFVNVLKPPNLPIMHASAEVKITHTPQTFELQAFLWQYDPPRRFHKRELDLIRSWKRYKVDLPAPGHSKTFRFPDLRVNSKQDELLACEPGPYFMQFHGFGDSSTGNRYDFHAYYPYNPKKPTYTVEPSPKQSWQVACTKTGQVPNPKGESPLVLVLTVP